MDEDAIKPKRKPKSEENQSLPPEWWDKRGLEHPLSDSDFVKAFCEHVLCDSNDHTLRIVRDRAYRFIRNFMAPVMEHELTRYRRVHS